jgi:serine phosphatase RsbU (regulator of sigma subunit)
MSIEDTRRFPIIEWGVSFRGRERGSESGDQFVVTQLPTRAVVAVADGLGHGQEAAEAAKLAVSTVEQHAAESIVSIINRCHQRLRGTRGAVISLAIFSAEDETVTWAGVGNVEGALVCRGTTSRERPRFLLPRSGVVGDKLPPLLASTMTVTGGDALVFVTDGVRTNFYERIHPCHPPQQIAESILHSSGREDDDALVLVARYVGS